MDVRNTGNDGHTQSQQQKSASKQNVTYHQNSLLQTQQQQQQQQQPVIGGLGSGVGGLKYHQLGDQNVTSTRFNEWDPYSSNRQQQLILSNERQKSPLK